MVTLKILLDDDLGYDFDLIAVHASSEPYYIAFLLNTHMSFGFERHKEDITVFSNESEVAFARYDYHDIRQDIDYYLISNKVKIEKNITEKGLFNNQKSTSTAHFIREKPQVDFFLKVKEDGNAFAKAKTKIIKSLNQIPQIVTAYSINSDDLKYKQNLIFE